MPRWPASPVVHAVNTWVWLQELSETAERALTLADVPQREIDRFASLGSDAVWLIGVWERSPEGARVAREHPGLLADFRRALPDFTALDVVGSPYAIRSYEVDPRLGGDEALRTLRQRLRSAGISLILDFVPNHLACDHPWTFEHPDRFVLDDRGQIAHGKDPYFPPWTDTLQLDYRKPGVREAMTDVLLRISGMCDAVRCDMAMLLLRDVFRRTWGGDFDPPDAEFWPDAIAAVRRRSPEFLFLAEVYWDLEYTLQQMGFDYTYDKTLYDRLRGGSASAVRDHLRAPLEYQRHLARFIENHDEERAAVAFPSAQRARTAAVIALTLPGLRLVHDGQIEGRRVRLPIQLRRRAHEEPDPETEQFYAKLLAAMPSGEWRLLEVVEAWAGNESWRNFVGFSWSGPSPLPSPRGAGRGDSLITVANLSADRSQCYLRIDEPRLAGRDWDLRDVLNDIEYRRNGDDLLARGLFLDMPGDSYHLFSLA